MAMFVVLYSTYLSWQYLSKIYVGVQNRMNESIIVLNKALLFTFKIHVEKLLEARSKHLEQVTTAMKAGTCGRSRLVDLALSLISRIAFRRPSLLRLQSKKALLVTFSMLT